VTVFKSDPLQKDAKSIVRGGVKLIKKANGFEYGAIAYYYSAGSLGLNEMGG